MNTNYSSSELIRAEIAALAARMIAEDGADYASAKRKAVKQLLGNSKVRGNVLPDNAQIEEELRAYNQIFFSETQPVRLRQLRELAVALMNELAEFSPFLTGAVFNGTAGEHSDIHLQLFVDNPKEVSFYLLNQRINFEISEGQQTNRRQEAIEVLSFMRDGEGVHLTLYAHEDLRTLPKSSGSRPERGDIHMVRTMLNE